MIKILTVVGARPQFIKAAMVSRAVRRRARGLRRPQVVEEIVHTGQHYDSAMSDVFFSDLGIPEPCLNLGVRASGHAAMTAEILIGLEKEIRARKPDWTLVYGDTNSTLAGALASAQLNVPLAHVEAGLRSFDRSMPEEVNRVLTDRLADLLLCPTRSAVENLRAEGLTGGLHWIGDVMLDAALAFGAVARQRSQVLMRLGLAPKSYFLATVHRAENADSRLRLGRILQGLDQLSRFAPVILPLHPRTRLRMDEFGLRGLCRRIRLIEPVGFLDMIRLEQEARAILTDSGGIQKEAFFQGVPCVTLRDRTEWVETVEAGWNRLVGADAESLVEAALSAQPGRKLQEYGRGDSADRVLDVLLRESA